jgi:hypothetical protein
MGANGCLWELMRSNESYCKLTVANGLLLDDNVIKCEQMRAFES